MKFFAYSIFLFFGFSNLFSIDRTVYTFKNHNFRLNLSSEWKLDKAGNSKNLVAIGKNQENEIFFEVFSEKQNRILADKKFSELLKLKNLRILNISNLRTEADFVFFEEGYFASTETISKDRIMSSYSFFVRDGINDVFIYIYTNKENFSKNFKTMKEVLSNFSFNYDYRRTCCDLCNSEKNKKKSCAEATKNDCKVFFANSRNPNVCKL
jgi:hypothetical protein